MEKPYLKTPMFSKSNFSGLFLTIHKEKVIAQRHGPIHPAPVLHGMI